MAFVCYKKIAQINAMIDMHCKEYHNRYYYMVVTWYIFTNIRYKIVGKTKFETLFLYQIGKLNPMHII